MRTKTQFIVKLAGYALHFHSSSFFPVYSLALHEVKPTVFSSEEAAGIVARSHGLAEGKFEICPK
jgi:hypothetical protein